MVIDCYGQKYTSEFFRKKKLEPYQIATDGNIVYKRFSSAGVGPIHKIDSSVSGTVTVTWAYGSWTNRASLTYNKTLNETIDVED